jgi:hypothetical protein
MAIVKHLGHLTRQQNEYVQICAEQKLGKLFKN